MDELIKAFSLDKVSKSGARFNPDKAKWFNAQYIRMADDARLAQLAAPIYAQRNINVTPERAAQAIALIKERATFPADLVDLTEKLFVRPSSYDEKSVSKFWKADNVARLAELRAIIAADPLTDPAAAEARVHDWIVSNNYSMGQLMNTLRLAIWGVSQGPSIFHIIAFIGKDEALARIDAAAASLGQGA